MDLTKILPTIGSSMALLMCISPLRRVVQCGKAKTFYLIPYIFLVVQPLTRMTLSTYGYVRGNYEYALATFFPFVAAAICLLIYHYYYGDLLVAAFKFSFLSVIYVIILTSIPIKVFAVIAMTLNIGSYASSFDKLIQAIKLKDPIYLDMWIISASIVNASVWLTYGTIIMEIPIIAPNIVNWLLCFSQIVAYFWISYRYNIKHTS